MPSTPATPGLKGRKNGGMIKKKKPPAAPTLDMDAMPVTPPVLMQLSPSSTDEAEEPAEDAQSFLAEALGSHRGSVTTPQVQRTAPGELPRRLLLGITLEGIQQLTASRSSDAIALAQTKSKRRALDGYTNAVLCKQDAQEDGLSTCERLEKDSSASIGLATIFVSWHFGTEIACLVDALTHYIEKHDLPAASTYFWISDFCMNQSRSVSADLARLPEIIGHIKHTVMLLEPWDTIKTCVPLKRIHCLWELYHTARTDSKFAAAVSHSALPAFTTALAEQFDDVQEALGSIDLRDAKASAPRDKEMILRAVEDSIGADTFNALTTRLMRAAIADEAREIVTALGPEERASRPSLVQSTAQLLHEAGDLTRAEPFYREALEALRARPFDKSTWEATVLATCGTMSSLATLLQARGDLNGAEALMREELQYSRDERGDRHPDTLTSINDLAVMLGDRGDLAAAEPLYREALKAQREDLGEQHPSTILSTNNLACVLRARGELADAVVLHEAALTAQRVVLGNRHESTLASVYNLGSLLAETGNFARAEELLAEEYNACKETKGEKHPETVASLENMNALLKSAGAA